MTCCDHHAHKALLHAGSNELEAARKLIAEQASALAVAQQAKSAQASIFCPSQEPAFFVSV